MTGILKTITLAALFVAFCYFFHEGDKLKALALQLGVLWLIVREARIRMDERGRMPRHRRSR